MLSAVLYNSNERWKTVFYMERRAVCMSYELKSGADIAAFLNAAGRCSGDVVFEDRNGNRLNLKNELSRYLFLAGEKDTVYVNGKLFCNDEDAETTLKNYII